MYSRNAGSDLPVPVYDPRPVGAEPTRIVRVGIDAETEPTARRAWASVVALAAAKPSAAANFSVLSTALPVRFSMILYSAIPNVFFYLFVEPAY